MGEIERHPGAILATGKRVVIIGGGETGADFEPIAGTEQTFDADLVLLVMGFLGPVRNGMLEQLGVKLGQRGNVAVGED